MSDQFGDPNQQPAPPAPGQPVYPPQPDPQYAPAPQPAPPAQPQQPAPQPQPGYAPQPQPQYAPQPGYAPPTDPYAAQPGYAPQPQQPVEPPRKKRGWIVALVLALVVVCGIGTCAIAAIGFGLFGGSGDTKAIGLAETHYSAATSAVNTATVIITKLESSSSTADSQKALDDATAAIRSGRDELAAAKVAIEPIADSQGKTDYLGSLTEANTAFDGLQQVIDYLGTANAMLADLSKASSQASNAMDDLNDAISLGNRSKYSQMKSKAKAARAGFDSAADTMNLAHKADTTAGLDKAVKYLRKRQAQADMLVSMAEDGRAKRFSSYNKRVKKMNALGRAADKIGQPAIVSDPNWAENRVMDMNEAAITAGKAADELHTKALQELEYTP